MEKYTYTKDNFLYIFFSILFVFGLYLHIIYLFNIYFVGSDDGIYLTFASEILKGKTPYVDFIDIHTPGVEYLLSASFAIFGETLGTAASLLLVINILTAFVIFRVGKDLLDIRVGALSALIYLYSLPVYDGASIYTEQFLNLFSTLGILAFLKYAVMPKKSEAYIFLSGVLIGVSVLFKQTAILTLLSILFYIMITKPKNSEEKPRIWRGRILLPFGFIIPLLITGLYFWVNGSLDYLIYNILILPTSKYPYNNITNFANNTLSSFYLLPLVWIFSIIYFAVLIFRYNQIRSPNKEILIAFWFIFSLYPTFLRQYPHYYIQALPAASIMTSIAGIVLWRITKTRIKSKYIRIISKIALITLAVALFIVPVYETVSKDIRFGNNRGLEKELEVAEYIKSKTAPDEKIYIFGCNAGFYFLSSRSPATKNPCFVDPNILDIGYTPANTIDEIKKYHVKYILVVDPLDNPYYSEVYDYVKKNYDLERNLELRLSFSNVRIYRSKSASPTVEEYYPISTFESKETWDGGMPNLMNVTEGMQSMSLTSMNGNWASAERNTNLNLEANFTDLDSIDIWAYTEEASNIEQIGFNFCNDHECRERKFYYMTSDFDNGWKLYRLSRMNYYTSGNGSWEGIKKISIGVKTKSYKNVTVVFDDWHMSK